MNHEIHTLPHTTTRIASFKPENGITERHVMITVNDRKLSYKQQLLAITDAYDHVCELYPQATPIFSRCFLSDTHNQAPDIPSDMALSIVGQAPLDQTKLALWLVMYDDVEILQMTDDTRVVRHGQYTHRAYSTSAYDGDAYDQTRQQLQELSRRLGECGGSLEANCQRTWLYVRDIDTNYAQMVKARNDIFDTERLTPATHFIASTGIGSDMSDPRTKVRVDAYCTDGLKPGQIEYLSAPTHLNPTIEYGVAFERATSITYGDRTHVLVSGTASIDNRGNILHDGDVVAQALRAIENTEALLAKGGCTLQDIASMIIYLRDSADYENISRLFSEKFPEKPRVIVLGPVCRPGWLVEIECVAVRCANTAYPPF